MTDFYNKKKSDNVRRYIIIGARRAGNYWWGVIALLGGLGLLTTGLSPLFASRQSLLLPLQVDSLEKFNVSRLPFFPQGLVMCFYGCLGVVFSLYLWFASICKIGSGFNEFNKKDGIIRVFRWGFPGRNRRIDFSYSAKSVQAIGVEYREGFNPRQVIYMRVKGKQPIPLTRLDELITLEQVESEAAELAQYLQIPLEN